jgi:hypothetical protein
MKKILVIITLVIGLIACKNQKVDFPNFDYTSGYFPYQYPVRTLVLGDYIYDNANDNNHMFVINVTMGGVYSNEKDRAFDMSLDPTLCKKVLFTSTNDTIRLMPATYYTLSSSTNIVIPKGEIMGGIKVQLTDAFFNDPLAIKNSYVIPLRLNGSLDVDTILKGLSVISNPDPRISTQWTIVPKDFTMFCVKYINPYHGTYLHRGVAVVKNAAATVLETTPYRTTFIEQNELWNVKTASMSQVTVTGNVRSTLITGTFNMLMTFAADGSCVVTQATGSAYTITGTGKFLQDGDLWGNKKRDVIYLQYQLTSGANTYFATDTLSIRDRAVVMEVYTPKVFAK